MGGGKDQAQIEAQSAGDAEADQGRAQTGGMRAYPTWTIVSGRADQGRVGHYP